MKKLTFITVSLLIVVEGLLSCKKEYSCEDCIGNNHPPLALARPDQVITLPTDSVLLNGGKSSDPDGKISAWQWTKLTGPASFTIVSATAAITTVKILKVGAYKFELKVTDDEGASARDTVMITVDSIATSNHPPVACAGADRTITLPTDTATLDGNCSTDPDNNISSYLWTKIAGPASVTIANANAATTLVSNLTEGVYQFELKVTDAGGLFSKDTVQVTVSPASKTCDANRPQVNAQLIPIGTLSEPRAEMAVASAGNKILFAGGYSTGGVSTRTRVDVFDFAANTWSTAELSSQRRGIAAVAAGNKIFFAGGENEGGDYMYTDVDIYDVATNTWSLSHMSTEGHTLTTATTGNKVFFAAGSYGIYATSTVNIYDLISNSWSTASLSAPRNSPVAVSANNKVYFTGGVPSTGPISNIIDIYNNATGVWSTSFLQVPRVWHAAIAVNDILYFAGGLSTELSATNYEPTCSVETLNTNTGARTLMNLSSPIAGLHAVVKDNKILFLRNDAALADSDKFDVYDIISNTWSIGVLPYKIGGASIISVNNTTYVAGVSINGVLSNKVWKLEF
jgi:hypothetical protein